ncbi:MAG: peptidylprolyl isomerase [Bacteroidaceae bacterium]|nr:peptidylprolyl isomerase [Bacteroidaceae bacterium]
MKKTDAKWFISVTYELLVEQDGEEICVEEATEKEPFQFVSGMGFTFDAFERQFDTLSAGDEFDFVLSSEETNGPRDEEFVFDVDKSIFVVDGKFQSEEVYDGNIIPLIDADGNRIQALVVEVKDDKVTLDLNNPLAGKALHFAGRLLEKHPATEEEIVRFTPSCCGCGGKKECGCDSQNDCGGCCAD